MREFLKNNNLDIPLQNIKSGDVTINLEYTEQDLVALCKSYIKDNYLIDNAEIYVSLFDNIDYDETLYSYRFDIDLYTIPQDHLDKLKSNSMFFEEYEDILRAALKNKFNWAHSIDICPRRESDFVDGILVISNIFDIRLGFKELEKQSECECTDFKSLLSKFEYFRMLKRKKDGIIIEDFYINGDDEPRISMTSTISKSDYTNALLDALNKKYPDIKELSQILELGSDELENLKRQAIEDIESYVKTWIYDEGTDDFNESVDFFMNNVDIDAIETKDYFQCVVDFFNSDEELYCCIGRHD